MSELNLGAHVLMIATDASAYVEKINALQARNLDYPVAEDLRDNDPFLVFYIPRGETGQDGQVGQDGQPGEQGPPGVCEDCEPGGQPDGGGGGPPGGDGGGSGGAGTGGTGPDGSNGPNPDGEDRIVFIPGCADPLIDVPFCSESFSYNGYDLRDNIVAAVEGTGQFNPATDELISVVLDWQGAAYGGVASVAVPTEVEYLPPQSNTAKFLTVEDAANNKMVVPHTIEKFGLDPVLVVQGYHYNGSTGLRMIPDSEPILLNGQMSNYPLIGGANCHTPPDETDPAWLKCCLRQFVKRPKAVALCAAMPLYQIFNRANFENNPNPQATIQNQAGWSGNTGDPGEVAITSQFNSKVDTIAFHPPTAGNANEHLQFTCCIGDGAPSKVRLFRVDFYDNGVDMHLNGETAQFNTYHQFTTSFEMVPGECYILEYQRDELHFVNCYDLGVKWV